MWYVGELELRAALKKSPEGRALVTEFEAGRIRFYVAKDQEIDAAIGAGNSFGRGTGDRSDTLFVRHQAYVGSGSVDLLADQVIKTFREQWQTSPAPNASDSESVADAALPAAPAAPSTVPTAPSDTVDWTQLFYGWVNPADPSPPPPPHMTKYTTAIRSALLHPRRRTGARGRAGRRGDRFSVTNGEAADHAIGTGNDIGRGRDQYSASLILRIGLYAGDPAAAANAMITTYREKW